MCSENGKQYGDLQNLLPIFAIIPWNFRNRVPSINPSVLCSGEKLWFICSIQSLVPLFAAVLIGRAQRGIAQRSQLYFEVRAQADRAPAVRSSLSLRELKAGLRR